MSNEKTITVQLDEQITTHQGIVTSVTLRQPTYEDFLEFGEVYSYVRTPGGTIIPSENTEAIRAYIERLVVLPVTPLLLSNASLKTARAIKGAVVGFFLGESSKGEDSEKSPQNSSGEPTSSAPIT